MGERSQRRGRHISKYERQQILKLIDKAALMGCRREIACQDLGLSPRTVERWKKAGALVDKRTTRSYTPKNKLTEKERAKILKVVNSSEFRDLSPHQIVPILLDRKTYYASESTLYRILRKEKMMAHRGKRRRGKVKRPKPCIATGPNQIWTWDITYLPSAIRGKYHYLYMIIDIYSRKLVGWEVHDQELAEHAAQLIEKACKSQKAKPGLVLHSDNGGPMKGGTMLAKLEALGVEPSFNRPGVSNDNPFSESLFRTLKYRPDFPESCFSSLADAKLWVQLFVHWYNHIHRHSALKFVTPHQRHTGKDQAILNKRKLVLEEAKRKRPERWTGETRNLALPAMVQLNPPKGKVGNKVKVADCESQEQQVSDKQTRAS